MHTLISSPTASVKLNTPSESIARSALAISRAYIEASALGDGFLIGEKLVKSSRRYARFRGDRICGGLVVTKAPEDCGSGAEESLLALLATSVALAIWIKDGHRRILAEKIKGVSKNLYL